MQCRRRARSKAAFCLIKIHFVNMEFDGDDVMEWFSVYSLLFIAVIMIPNIVFAVRWKEGFENKQHNKVLEIMEQMLCHGD